MEEAGVPRNAYAYEIRNGKVRRGAIRFELTEVSYQRMESGSVFVQNQDNFIFVHDIEIAAQLLADHVGVCVIWIQQSNLISQSVMFALQFFNPIFTLLQHLQAFTPRKQAGGTGDCKAAKQQ
jgi:hypothetical protein